MLTLEQQKVVDTVCSTTDDRIIAVNSIAGSGKTSTGAAVIDTYKPTNGFYTAFNKAIVQDSTKRFGDKISCKTIHALAYKFVKPSREIEDLNYLTIKENIPYEDKALVITILDDFFRSNSLDIEDFTKTQTSRENIQDLVFKYANLMLDGKISPTFNYLLKCLHIMLADKEIEIDFDLLILDECQDTTAVTLEIFKLINAKRKVIFGDKFQNIYSFMNTVNAFEELDDLHILKLTKSFRCNLTIANTIEEYGKNYLEPSFIYTGNEFLDTTNDTTAFITRTNANLINRMYELLFKGFTFKLTRNINEIFALPIALLNASSGRPVFDKRYKYLQKEFLNYSNVKRDFSSFFQYITMITNDIVLENTCKLLTNFATRRINLYDIKQQVQNMKTNPKIILTTAHAFKGLEADSVYIEDDLNNSVNRTIKKIKSGATKDALAKEDVEDLNTYYVALSRARYNLSNVNYER